MHRGSVLALTAAVLFGASTLFAKLIIASAHPALQAGLLYLGSCLGLSVFSAAARPRLGCLRNGCQRMAAAHPLALVGATLACQPASLTPFARLRHCSLSWPSLKIWPAAVFKPTNWVAVIRGALREAHVPGDCATG